MIRLILRTRNDRLNLAFLWAERIKSRMGEEKSSMRGGISRMAVAVGLWSRPAGNERRRLKATKFESRFRIGATGVQGDMHSRDDVDPPEAVHTSRAL